MMYWNTMGFFGWTMMIVFWVAVVALIVWAVRSTASTRRESEPIDILDRRFALGEIDGDEYEKRRRTLESQRLAASSSPARPTSLGVGCFASKTLGRRPEANGSLTYRSPGPLLAQHQPLHRSTWNPGRRIGSTID